MENVKFTKKLSFKDKILKPHNQAVYQKVRDAFLDTDRVLIEQATGTGKSYVTLKLIKDMASRSGMRVLFVAPRKFLLSDFKELCGRMLSRFNKVERKINLETSTYHNLKNMINKQYDLVVFDEAHRLGAESWGKFAKKLLE